MTKTPGLLPRECRDELARAMLIPDRNERLDAIDKARERAAYKYPDKFKTETNYMQVKLKNVRLAFGDGLWAAKSFGSGEDKSKPKFQCSFLLPPDHPQIGEIKAAMVAVAKEKWGVTKDEKSGKEAWQIMMGLCEKKDRLALHDGDNKTYDGYAGNLYMSASNAQRPTVVNKDRTALTQADGVVYSGCYVNAIVDIWAQDNKWGKGVNVSLGGVQFFADGDAFSGAAVVGEDEFDDLGADTGAGKAETSAW